MRHAHTYLSTFMIWSLLISPGNRCLHQCVRVYRRELLDDPEPNWNLAL